MQDLLHEEKAQFVANLLKDKAGKLLDVGCFKGKLGLYLNPKFEYFGIDIDSKALGAAKENLPNSKFATCDLNKNNLPFNTKFNFIVALDVLEHTHDPAKVLSEMKENLASDGVLLIALPNDYHLLNRLRFLLNRPISPEPFWAYTHLHIFTMKQAEEFLMQNKLEITGKYYLPGTKPKHLHFLTRMTIAKNFPNIFCRGVLYICKLK